MSDDEWYVAKTQDDGVIARLKARLIEAQEGHLDEHQAAVDMWAKKEVYREAIERIIVLVKDVQTPGNTIAVAIDAVARSAIIEAEQVVDHSRRDCLSCLAAIEHNKMSSVSVSCVKHDSTCVKVI